MGEDGDRHGIKVTSHMVGQEVERNTELAKEIVDRGHEATGHGQTWEPQYSMTPEQERAGFAMWMPSLDPTPRFIAIPEARRVFDLVQRTGAAGS